MPAEIPDNTEFQSVGKGTVILWEDYEFINSGEKKNSRFLILSDCHPQYRYFLGIRATTKTEFYERPTSTIEREFLIIREKEEVSFTKKVAIDFANIKMLDLEKIRKGWGVTILKLKPASDNLIKKIDESVSKSKIIRKDWINWIIKSPNGI